MSRSRGRAFGITLTRASGAEVFAVLRLLPSNHRRTVDSATPSDAPTRLFVHFFASSRSVNRGRAFGGTLTRASGAEVLSPLILLPSNHRRKYWYSYHCFHGSTTRTHTRDSPPVPWRPWPQAGRRAPFNAADVAGCTTRTESAPEHQFSRKSFSVAPA
jgi:hypothetical protein